MKSGNSVVGTPYTSVRYRPDTAVAVTDVPERAVEQSLREGTTVQRVSASVDPARATAFKPSKSSEAEGRIGVAGGNGSRD